MHVDDIHHCACIERFCVSRILHACAINYSKHAHTFQSGLTALKLAQSEGHQDVYDILLQYTQQGSKVTSPEPAENESRQEEETKVWVPERNEIQVLVVIFTLTLFRSQERVHMMQWSR